MKRHLILLVFLMSTLFVNAQSTMQSEDWEKVIGHLQNEEWQQANALSATYLKRIPAEKIEENEAAILRYMFILSESGMMNENNVSKEEAIKSVKGFVGHTLILAGHPIKLKYGMNSIQLVSEKTDTLMITATNKKATQIFCFEYVIQKQPISLGDFKASENKVGRIAGRLKTINAEGNFLPRFKIFIDEAKLEID